MGHNVISHAMQCKDLDVVITNSLFFAEHNNVNAELRLTGVQTAF